MRKEYKKALIGAVVLVLLGLLFLLKIRNRAEPDSFEVSEPGESVLSGWEQEDAGMEKSLSDPETESSRIIVYVSGAVCFPGVYELSEGSRVNDALLAAGGLLEKAEEGLVNLAEPLSDGEMIYFPEKGEDPEPRAQLSDGKTDLNLADKEELMRLPGIGEAKAEAILQYRKEHGSFQAVEELMLVSGIGEGLFEKIRNRIKV